MKRCPPSALGLLLALICAPAPAPAQEPPDPVLQQALREVRAIRGADAVVTARVVRVRPSPGIWCGTAVTRQVVVWRLERVVDGVPIQGMGGTVEVGHLLVANSRLVSTNAPFLRPDLIYPGARALLFVALDDAGGCLVTDEDYGVRLLDPPLRPDRDVTLLLRQVLGSAELRPYLHLDQPGRLPLCVQLGAALPNPVPLEVGGQPVEFLPAELLRERACLVIDQLTVEAERARVRLHYPVEGIAGDARFARQSRGWKLESFDVVERKERVR